MAESHYYYQAFMSAIQRKIQHRATLVNTITDILAIDKDAVYRRLRGEVHFSFIEMALIAKNLGVSIDSIVGIESEQSKPTIINITRHLNPTPLDYRMFNDYIDFLKYIKDEPETILLSSGNMPPHYLFYDYEYITRLFTLCWCHSSNFGRSIPYHEIILPEQMKVLQKNCCLYTRHIKSTNYVWDRSIFQRIVDNIKFFARIRLIKGEDIYLIKNDLIMLINHIEKLAVTGKHEDTGNQVSIYISDIYIETNYSSIKTQNMTLGQFNTFLLCAISAFDEAVYTEISSWILTRQRMSTLISVSGEKFRAEYFDKQREIILTL